MPQAFRAVGTAQGPVTMMGMAGGMNAHLAQIEKLSNGYIVRFQKAQKIMVKKRTMAEIGFDDETRDMIRLAMEKMKEGEAWKALPEEVLEAAKNNEAKQLERWVTTPMAVACKTEPELLEAIRQAVTAHAEIEKLELAGEFSAY